MSIGSGIAGSSTLLPSVAGWLDDTAFRPLVIDTLVGHPAEFLLFPIWLLVGAFSALSIVDPERAFRYENIFQIREIELTPLGKFLQIGGGFVVLLLAPLIAVSYSFGLLSVLSVYGAAAYVIFQYRPLSEP